MCAPNKTKKENKAFSCLFRTRSPYLPWCQAAWAPRQEWKFFFIRRELHVNGYWGVLPSQHNITSYQTHCGLSVRQRTGISCMQHNPNLSTSLFSDLWPQEPRCDCCTPLIIRFRESYNEYESRLDKFEEIQRRLLKTGKAEIQHFEWNDAISELLHFLR